MPAPAGSERPAIPFVSLIIPVYNEESCIEPFVAAASTVLNALRLPYELLFVNDGSTDLTQTRLITLSASHPSIRVVSLSRNFSKEAALTAGLDYSRGDVVIPIDVDLQDPPELISRFIELWREGYDVVYGVRTNREGDRFSKRLTSGLFYKVFNRLSPIPIPEDVGEFRLMDRRIVEILKVLPERNRFMQGLFAWVGFKSIEVPYIRPGRKNGATKWSYWRLWNFALDGFVGFSTLPLRIWTYVGGVITAASVIAALIILFRMAVLGVSMPGYALIVTAVFLIGGVQLLSLGIIGEYLGRLFEEVKKRPVYLVDSVHESVKLKADEKR